MQHIVDVCIFNIPTVGSYRPQPLRNRVKEMHLCPILVLVDVIVKARFVSDA